MLGSIRYNNNKKNTAPVNDPTGSILTQFMKNEQYLLPDVSWIDAVTKNSNSTNNNQINLSKKNKKTKSTSKIFFYFKFYGVPFYRPTTYKTKIMFLVEFNKTFEKKFSFSLPTSLEFLYTRLVKKDINLSYTLLCCIISPKFLGSTLN